MVEGIDRGALVPFRYWGVPDVVDFEPIPWRNGRFDPEELTRAVTTLDRAEHAIREWSQRRGSRTLAFCASTLHADFMAEQFHERGFRAVAVHSKESSAPRHSSIAALEAGELDVVCSVDVFNEGLDVPSVDTVLMLRPSESPVIFMQQLGRGLRLSEGKDHLRVIDFIGNHRSFLSRPRTLLSLGTGTTPSIGDVFDAAARGDFHLPPGCSVDYSLEAVRILERLRGPAGPGDALIDFCRAFTIDEGTRPTAAQTLRSGLNPGSAKGTGGWFRFLATAGLLQDDEQRVVHRHGDLLGEIERSSVTKSYKLVTLRALLHEGALSDGMSVDLLSDAARQIVCADPRLIADTTSAELPDVVGADAAVWRNYWRRWPIAAWTGELSKNPSLWFATESRSDAEWFVPRFDVDLRDVDTLAALVAELVEYRLARYLAGKDLDNSHTADEPMICRVGHASGRPIVWLNRRQNHSMPVGTVQFAADGNTYDGDFRKEALKVARLPGVDGNALHSLLRGWFGPSAGHPGTLHKVIIESNANGLVMRTDVAAPTGQTEEAVPLFPTLAVACGSFAEPDRQIHDASTFHVFNGAADVADRSRNFVAYARGDSMDGGVDPVRHGDPLMFEWVRGVDRRDLVGQRVLVEYRNGGTASALKRLALVGGHYRLDSDNTSVPSIDGVSQTQIVARLVRRLSQDDVNPLAAHLGKEFSRRQISALHGDPDQRTNWSQGHVSLPGAAVLLVTLDKSDMSGISYRDHFEGSDVLVWSSQNSTSPEGKKGREVLDALETGTQLHLWVRRKKPDGAFNYLGLVVPVTHEGAKPMSVRFRLLTPLDSDLQRRFGVT